MQEFRRKSCPESDIRIRISQLGKTINLELISAKLGRLVYTEIEAKF